MGQARRKLRRVGKWAGLVVALSLLSIDIASTWYPIQLSTPNHPQGGAYAGRVRFTWLHGAPVPRRVWSLALDDPLPAWRSWHLEWQTMPGPRGVEMLNVPIWWFTMLFVAPTAYLWWRDRRDKGPGHCPACGYDLRGLAKDTAGAMTCPECGRPSSATSA